MKRIWDNPINEFEARALASDLCIYACNGSKGRPEKGDAVYDTVTEHRDFGAKYSSCADLAHWMLFRLGCRHKFINRKEHLGWRTGVNLSRVAWSPFTTAANSGDRFLPGDILVIWARPDTQDAHVTVVLRDWRFDNEDLIQTANYGAPGGSISTSKVTYRNGLAILGTRPIRRVLRLWPALTQMQATGCLVDGDEVPGTGE
jgi:hypothetical protein